jgi:hypothetical protein
MEEDTREKKQLIQLSVGVSSFGFATLVFWIINTIHFSHHDSIPSSILHTTPVIFVSDLHEIFGPLGAVSILISDLIVFVWVALIAVSLYVSLYVSNKNNRNKGLARRLLIVTLISISILALDLVAFGIERYRERLAETAVLIS